MRTVLIGIVLISGFIFVASVLLMSPKGGIGFGIGGMAGGHEYGSKKSVERVLKKVAFWTSIIFIGSIIVLPYVK